MYPDGHLDLKLTLFFFCSWYSIVPAGFLQALYKLIHWRFIRVNIYFISREGRECSLKVGLYKCKVGKSVTVILDNVCWNIYTLTLDLSYWCDDITSVICQAKHYEGFWERNTFWSTHLKKEKKKVNCLIPLCTIHTHRPKTQTCTHRTHRRVLLCKSTLVLSVGHG